MPLCPGHAVTGNPLPAPSTRLDPRTCTLLVVDMQRYDADPECGIGPGFREADPDLAAGYFERIRELVIPNVVRLRDRCRRHGVRVIYTRSGATLPDGADLSRHRRARYLGTANGRRSIFRQGEPEYELLPALAARSDELILHKNTVSAFNSSALDRILRNSGTSTLIVAGVVTDGCVDSTARDATDLGYECVIASDATAAWRPEWHDQALATFARYWGTVATTAEICERLGWDVTSSEEEGAESVRSGDSRR